MRHSIRYPIIDISQTLEVGLTPEGFRLAEEFGALMASSYQPGRLFASPVGRCIDTAAAIAHGASWPDAVTMDYRLGHPHINMAWIELITHQNQNGLPEAVTEVLNLVLNNQSDRNLLDIFVTHDTVVGCVAGYTTGDIVTEENWPEFLEGLAIWRTTSGIGIAWRGGQVEVARESLMNPVSGV
jgi:hypothetical protein